MIQIGQPRTFLQGIQFRHAAGQTRNRSVGHIAGLRNQGAVAGVKVGQRQPHNAGFATQQGENLCGGVEPDAEFAFVKTGNGLFERCYAAIRLIAVCARIVEVTDQTVHHLGRRRKVGIADGHYQKWFTAFVFEPAHFGQFAGKIIIADKIQSLRGFHRF